jgi:hypothetical protein
LAKCAECAICRIVESRINKLDVLRRALKLLPLVNEANREPNSETYNYRRLRWGFLNCHRWMQRWRNFGRPLITVDRGDTSGVSSGRVLGDLQRPWRCPTSSDARNATTEATSAGCAILLSACMPVVTGSAGPPSWRSSRAPNRHPVPLPLCHCHIATSIRFPRGVVINTGGFLLRARACDDNEATGSDGNSGNVATGGNVAMARMAIRSPPPCPLSASPDKRTRPFRPGSRTAHPWAVAAKNPAAIISRVTGTERDKRTRHRRRKSSHP